MNWLRKLFDRPVAPDTRQVFTLTMALKTTDVAAMESGLLSLFGVRERRGLRYVIEPGEAAFIEAARRAGP